MQCLAIEEGGWSGLFFVSAFSIRWFYLCQNLEPFLPERKVSTPPGVPFTGSRWKLVLMSAGAGSERQLGVLTRVCLEVIWIVRPNFALIFFLLNISSLDGIGCKATKHFTGAFQWFSVWFLSVYLPFYLTFYSLSEVRSTLMLNQPLAFISTAKMDDTNTSSIKHWPSFIR